MDRVKMGRISRAGLSTMVAILVALAAAAGAQATTVSQAITSGGPLSHIWVGNDLDCQVQYGTLSAYEFFPSSSAPGDCGTFLSVNAAGSSTTPTLYGPNLATNPDESAASALGTYTTYTPQTQTSVTGAGTSASPYTVTTTVAAASTGITITEVDTYVVGNLYYQSDITVRNGTTSALDAYLYRAADCYLQGSDQGYGALSGSSPECTQNPNNTPAAETESFVPLTAGNSWDEDDYNTVWGTIAQGGALPNTIATYGTGTSANPTMQDNGAAVAWPITRLAAGQSQTFSVQTSFFGTPVSTGGLPAITGSATYGSTLTESHGSYNPAPTDYAYQWEDCDPSGNTCTPITGATGQTYTVTSSDIGNTIRVIETAVNSAGPTDQETSNPTLVVPATPVTVTTRQTASGTSGTSLSVPAGTTGETDRATLSGLNVAQASGSIVYALYSKSSCVSSSRVFTSSPQTVAGATAPASSPVTTVLAPGTYYWQAIYSGDVENEGAASSCGKEKLTVTAGTVVSNQASTDGKQLTLTAGCAVVPCTLKVLVTVTERVAIPTSTDLAFKRVKRRYRNRSVTVAIESVTIKKVKKKKKGVHTQITGVAIDTPLTQAGQRFIDSKRRHHVKHVKLRVKITETVHKKKLVATTSTINVALDAPAAKG